MQEDGVSYSLEGRAGGMVEVDVQVSPLFRRRVLPRLELHKRLSCLALVLQLSGPEAKPLLYCSAARTQANLLLSYQDTEGDGMFHYGAKGKDGQQWAVFHKADYSNWGS